MALVSRFIDADQTHGRVTKFSSDAIKVRPGTLLAGCDGVGGGFGEGTRDDVGDRRRDHGDGGAAMIAAAKIAAIVFNMTAPCSRL
jgi:hypothetical protein